MLISSKAGQPAAFEEIHSPTGKKLSDVALNKAATGVRGIHDLDQQIGTDACIIDNDYLCQSSIL